MITHYFGFTTMPFLKDIPPKDMFSWKEFENLNQRLGYFLKEGGIFLLTGLIGSGKTVALKYFAHSTNPNSHHIIYLNCMFDTKKDFYQTILKECGVNPSFFTGDCRSMLKKYILDMHYTKRLTPILIFDEAQNLPGFLIEEIRLLSNFDFDSSSPLLIILAGHKLLQQRMAMHENEALRQRLTLRFHLQGLNLEDTCAYIRHRLSIAGSTSSIFADSVLSKVHDESAGIPRVINNICKTLLLGAASNEKKIIDEYLLEQTRGEWECSIC